MLLDAGPFHGYPCQRIESPHLQIDFLTNAGPRIVRLFVKPFTQNLLAELPGEAIQTTRGPFVMHGGHRLWHSPEDNPRTYLPDDRGLTVEEIPGGVRLTQPVETETGIEKSIEIHLSPDQPTLTIHHNLANRGMWPVELAPWAITQLPIGGLVILPEPDLPSDRHGLQPNRHLVMWPYARWHDQRLHLEDGYVMISAEPLLPPIKVGILSTCGWVGFLNHNVLLCKRFDPFTDKLHPDFNCNAESYCNNIFIELETLGPSVRLEPDQSTVHTERWEIYANIDVPYTIDGVREMVNTLHL